MLVPTGPLTNVALLLERHPDVSGRLEAIVWMGGAVGEGNATPAAEFNAFVDPEAAAAVFASGIPLTMIGLDVTHKALFTRAHAERLRGAGRAGRFVAELSDFFQLFHERSYGFAGSPIHDAMAVAHVIDPTLVASHVVVALQSVASRNVDPLKQVVVSVCTFRTESEAFNVIPQTVLLRASIRTMDPEVQDFVEGRIKAIVENTCAAFGATAEIDYRRGYPVTMNAEENTGYAVEAAKRVTENVDADAVPLMGSEDFSFMLNARPGAYIFLGNGDTAMVHHPKYNFDDNAIPFGSSWYAEMVESRMPAA